MRTVWTIIGLIVLIGIIIFIARRYQMRNGTTTFVPIPVQSGVDPSKNTTVTERTVIQPQPVIIVTRPSDCNTEAYRVDVQNKYDIYLQKRVIWQNGVNSNDPNTIQYREDMNNAYNEYYQQAKLCNYFYN